MTMTQSSGWLNRTTRAIKVYRRVSTGGCPLSFGDNHSAKDRYMGFSIIVARVEMCDIANSELAFCVCGDLPTKHLRIWPLKFAELRRLVPTVISSDQIPEAPGALVPPLIRSFISDGPK
jgi:hypothetical protein